MKRDISFYTWNGLWNNKKIVSDVYSLSMKKSIGGNVYNAENAMFFFNKDNRLYQVGVTIGFTSKLDDCIGIGSTMADVKIKYGGYYEEYDDYLIDGLEGIYFELGDTDEDDDWDELAAPIKWIFVYDTNYLVED